MALSGLDETPPISAVNPSFSSSSPPPPPGPCRSCSAPTSVKLSQLVNPAVCFSAQPLSLRDLRSSAAFELLLLPPMLPSSPPESLSDCCWCGWLWDRKHEEKAKTVKRDVCAADFRGEGIVLARLQPPSHCILHIARLIRISVKFVGRASRHI